jgi:hypothetical protein
MLGAKLAILATAVRNRSIRRSETAGDSNAAGDREAKK